MVGGDTDYALAYANSSLKQQCLDKISGICSQKTVTNEIRFPTIYATDFFYQATHVCSRLLLVYRRSPGYNGTRLVIGTVIALLFGENFVNLSLTFLL